MTENCIKRQSYATALMVTTVQEEMNIEWGHDGNTFILLMQNMELYQNAGDRENNRKKKNAS